MLRVLVFEEPFNVTLRLEGELTAQTVAVLVQRWADLRPVLGNRKVTVDMATVSALDESAQHALKSLFDSGARLRNVAAALRNKLPDVTWGDPTDVRPNGIKSALKKIRRNHELLPRMRRLLCLMLPVRMRPCGCRAN